MNIEKVLRLIINIILAEFRLYISEENAGYVYFTYPIYNKKVKNTYENLYLLSYDEEDAFSFLNLNYKQFLIGITPDAESMAKYLSESPYMNFESLDISYHKYFTSAEDKKCYWKIRNILKDKFKATFDFPSYDNFYLYLASKHFAADIIKMVEADNDNTVIFPDRYNAKLIMKYTGLKEGKELGTIKNEFIEYIENKHGESFNSFLYRYKIDEIEKIFLNYFNKK